MCCIPVRIVHALTVASCCHRLLVAPLQQARSSEHWGAAKMPPSSTSCRQDAACCPSSKNSLLVVPLLLAALGLGNQKPGILSASRCCPISCQVISKKPTHPVKKGNSTRQGCVTFLPRPAALPCLGARAADDARPSALPSLDSR